MAEVFAETATLTTSFKDTFVTQESTALAESNSTPTPKPPTVFYYAQSGDWLPALAVRFGVALKDITSPKPLSERGLLNPGTVLIIPDALDRSKPFTPSVQLIPDNELVFSSSAIDFDIAGYVQKADGYLSRYRQYLGTTGWTSGARARTACL